LSFSSTLDTSTEEIFQQGVGWNINPPLFQRNDGNIIWDPPFSTTSIAQQNPSPNPSLAINISGPLPPTAPISPLIVPTLASRAPTPLAPRHSNVITNVFVTKQVSTALTVANIYVTFLDAPRARGRDIVVLTK
jgi:hypothetical protein